MTTLTELVCEHTTLRPDQVDHLHRLVADWQLLADLSFADLLLWVRVRDELVEDLAGHLPHRGRGGVFLAVAQMRPTTGPTAYQDDKVGAVAAAMDRPLLARAYDERRICREGEPVWVADTPVREETIPVVYAGDAVAVLSRDTNLASARVPSQLELAYLEAAGALAEMVATGRFPGPERATPAGAGPRVGDGFVRTDPDRRVTYASPNALSAYRRLGLAGDLVGADLAELSSALVFGAVPEPTGGARPRRVLDLWRSADSEVEAHGAVVALRTLPLRRDGADSGAVVLVRDVTEVRFRDRALLSKDATIREIHHRVKNNLQTVAALLRLQARRVDEPAARLALEESVRRVSAIALVHETLSVTLDESVDFDGIADQLLTSAAEAARTGVPVQTRRAGSFGPLPAPTASALAMVLNELVHNAVEHAFPAETGGGTVLIDVERQPDRLRMRVTDDGAGLPAGFRLADSPRLGLQIVRTLVGTELGGAVELLPREGRGTQATVDVPVRPAAS